MPVAPTTATRFFMNGPPGPRNATRPAITGWWARASWIRGRGRVGQVDRRARGTGPAGRSPVGHGTGDPSRVLSVVRVARPAIPSELYPGPTRAAVSAIVLDKSRDVSLSAPDTYFEEEEAAATALD